MGAGFENLWAISGVAGGIIIVLALVLFVLRARGSLNARRNGRLAILDYYEVDKNRRLVIVRRDNIEHLLLIGGTQDLLIEKAFNKPADEADQPRERMFRNDFADELANARATPLRTPERAPPHLRPVPSRTEPRLNETDQTDKPDGEPPSDPANR
ncbi:MAG: flagellar biosynthetic protein FliO [Aestuariivirgaceae bacterium]|nr:flagellar biosynthetic protein FliO [Aestuariivirgaceae bacterium]